MNYTFTVLYSFDDIEEGKRKEKEVLEEFSKTVSVISAGDTFEKLEKAVEALENIAGRNEDINIDDLDKYDLIELAQETLDKI